MENITKNKIIANNGWIIIYYYNYESIFSKSMKRKDFAGEHYYTSEILGIA